MKEKETKKEEKGETKGSEKKEVVMMKKGKKGKAKMQTSDGFMYKS